MNSIEVTGRPKTLPAIIHGETVARIVRRLRPVKTEGLTRLQNVIHVPVHRSLDPPFVLSTSPLLPMAFLIAGCIAASSKARRGP